MSIGVWSGWSRADRCGGAGLVLVELKACLELDDPVKDLPAFHGRTTVACLTGRHLGVQGHRTHWCLLHHPSGILFNSSNFWCKN